MKVRNAKAVWEGNLKQGSGSLELGSGLFHGNYTYASRFEEGKGTNPDELVGAALASCFSMFLANLLATNEHLPRTIEAQANVHLGEVDGAPTITGIDLNCKGDVPGISKEAFQDFARQAKEGCPVSKALAVDIQLNAQLAQ